MAVGLSLALALGGTAWGQNAPASGGAAAPVGAADPAAAFQQAVADYKQAIRSIEKLRTEHQGASAERQAQINSELQTQIASTQAKVDAMLSSALEAFRAAPMADPEVTKLLVAAVEHQMVGRGAEGGGDDYEAALPVIEALVDAGHERTELPLWGAFAAVVTNQFDLADKFAAVVEERKTLQTSPGTTEAAQDTFDNAIRYLKERDRFRARWEAESKIQAQDAAADNLPRVLLTTSKGDVVIELFEDQAPIATANFLTLAKDGFYDGVVFHRVLPRFMAQGGDPTGTGSGGPGYAIACECARPDARKHFRGTLSMAHAGRNTGGSQFFLCFVPTEHLDGRHTAFGRVVEGFGVLADLNRVDPNGPSPPADKILSAKVLRDRGHSYSFEKLPGR
ncbi:putative bifunctional phosphatase/peptidyl-prolyl cis-trans isomerase [Botrimarina hoheduenensis]|uniref:peptidylprolyl isomerase n=2 Tax=Botrimarina hoheduenensis TaxID=2528000 RepID=A0A5C5WB17_9BACT|nr:putative bifunctional phosphatase/peptidyl-prolyl cis-trans isomerase [Botrimarina hoheduenensis]